MIIGRQRCFRNASFFPRMDGAEGTRREGCFFDVFYVTMVLMFGAKFWHAAQPKDIERKASWKSQSLSRWMGHSRQHKKELHLVEWRRVQQPVCKKKSFKQNISIYFLAIYFVVVGRRFVRPPVERTFLAFSPTVLSYVQVCRMSRVELQFHPTKIRTFGTFCT